MRGCCLSSTSRPAHFGRARCRRTGINGPQGLDPTTEHKERSALTRQRCFVFQPGAEDVPYAARVCRATARSSDRVLVRSGSGNLRSLTPGSTGQHPPEHVRVARTSFVLVTCWRSGSRFGQVCSVCFSRQQLFRAEGDTTNQPLGEVARSDLFLHNLAKSAGSGGIFRGPGV